CVYFLGETCFSWRHHAVIALDRSGRGRLKAAPAGLYRLGVALPGAGRAGSSQLVETSSRSSDPDEVHVALSMREWTIRGRVVREDGEGQKAKVNGSTLVSERRRGVSDALFTAEADEAGWFVASFIAEEGVRFGLMATSEEPPARGRKAPLVAGPEVEASGIEVPLTATGVRVVLTDRQDGRPLANCAVRVSRTRDRRMLEGTTTDRDGQATSFVDFGEEAVRVGAECEGYVRPDEAVVELEEGELARTRLALDASRGLSVRVLGASGSPVGGASVFVLEHSISTNQPAYWLEPTLAGVTAEDGRLQLRGDRFGGRPMYVVGPGSGLFVGWLPSAIAARGSEAESIDVALSPPSTSPGVSVVTASGRFALPSWILFEKQGIPVPARILFDLARANGLILDSFFTDEESFLSRYLGPGEYAVSYLVHDRKLGALRAVPLGAMTLPAADRTEFRAMFIP
ncbi:MAG: hypothetical protein KJ062_22995, partial [Thermoanaerobaculia bacterium]|nr:hypothetical protein [Thermoanaerobaculia bacterium]